MHILNDKINALLFFKLDSVGRVYPRIFRLTKTYPKQKSRKLKPEDQAICLNQTVERVGLGLVSRVSHTPKSLTCRFV